MEVLSFEDYNGAPLGQWDCVGGLNQLWSGAFTGNFFEVHNNADNYKCAEVLNWSGNAGDPLGIWDCHYGANQTWISGLNATGNQTPFTTFGPYSYGSSSCSSPVDPIGIIFINGNGSGEHPAAHALREDHGSYDWKDGGQYFKAGPIHCNSGSGSAATEFGLCEDRYHMRWGMADVVTTGWSYAATPHFDDYPGPPSPCQHCIPSDSYVNARYHVWNNWTAYNKHPQAYTTFWGNTELFSKCNQWVRGDGYVDYISLLGNDFW